jgi:predicted RND superfamily exporter protein
MIRKLAKFCIHYRVMVLIILGLSTVILGYFALRLEIKTLFDDLIPHGHPYIKINDAYKSTFGGYNMVSIMLETKKGDIFSIPILEKIRKLQNDLRLVDGVNQFQIVSLASRKLKEVTVTSEGIAAVPVMDTIPKNEEEIEKLREAVLRNPLVYGAFVSHDLKSALITVDFHDHLIDYQKVFDQVREIVYKVKDDDIRLRIVGEPILYGWVRHHFTETLFIFLLTIAGSILLLFLTATSWRGTLLPLLSACVGAIWALGIAKLLNFNFDPLVMVLASLILVRSVSHTTQQVMRFDDELDMGAPTPEAAAEAAITRLFKPAMVSIATDAGGMIIVALTPIPVLVKIAIVGTVWICTNIITCSILTPVLLSFLGGEKKAAHGFGVAPYLHTILEGITGAVTSKKGRAYILIITVIIFLASCYLALPVGPVQLTVGDANPGSPILWPDSEYNRNWDAINKVFQGSDRMFVVYAGDKSDVLKEPKVLQNMVRFQRFMETQPEIGGTISLADIIPPFKRMLHEANPRYEEIGDNVYENAELMYIYISGSDPGDIDRLCDSYYQNASVTLFFRDHKGETIRTAVSRINEFKNLDSLEEVPVKLAGGLIGVLASINEVILRGQIQSIALALLCVILFSAITYKSMKSGIFFMAPLVMSNTITFAYMAWKGIGMNINTLPVAALGIGLGVDYAYYVVDGIIEELKTNKDIDLTTATRLSMHSAGRAVIITAVAMIFSVFLWLFSSLRFQAEMGILIGIWFFVSAATALLVTPSLIFLFRPEFIVGKEVENKNK